ncbi:MAG: TIGR04282 family arsenosugar biosynthesis glycosyltransferase [Nitrospirae bacterium]|nr:TIGR04282 family arsenosugar biosynthesis glycosyltransferase [Magnetococcales bacterium]HAT50844.1 flagellar biosynthesis protein FlgB [Alphaproteobacteria bacterium]
MPDLAAVSLNILTRTPEAGKVKTRLIPALGIHGALRAHEQLLTHVVHTAQSWCQGSENRSITLWCTPSIHHPVFDPLLPPSQRRLQHSGDLGQRLAAIATEQLQRYHGIILLGGDSASVTKDLLEQTQDALAHHDAVMAPAEDGGYVLLGLTRFHPMLFQSITWGSASVAAETRNRLTTLQWPWKELALQWDVDRLEDWQRFKNEEDLRSRP